MYVLTVTTANKKKRVNNVPSIMKGIMLLKHKPVNLDLGIDRVHAVAINDTFREIGMVTFELLDKDLTIVGTASIQIDL